MAFASMFNTDFTAKPKSHNHALDSLLLPTAPNAAACSSASALFICNDLLFSCVCFQGVSSQHQDACT